jgi:hypothetical protein
MKNINEPKRNLEVLIIRNIRINCSYRTNTNFVFSNSFQIPESSSSSSAILSLSFIFLTLGTF